LVSSGGGSQIESAELRRPHIDANRIGVAGHSAGGTTVIELAGAIFSPAQIQEFCKSNPGTADPNCHLPAMIQEQLDKFVELQKTDPVVQDSMRRSQLPYNDSRIKAVFCHGSSDRHRAYGRQLESDPHSCEHCCGTSR
jgi:predicted dienelactone hydrolase